MKKRSISLLLISVMLFTLALCGCGGSDKDSPEYAGTWKTDSNDKEYHYTMIIGDEGNVTVKCFERKVEQWSDDGTVAVNDGKMTFNLLINGNTVSYTYKYKIDGKKLKLTYSGSSINEHLFSIYELEKYEKDKKFFVNFNKQK